LSKKVLYPLLALCIGTALAALLVVTEPPPQADNYVAPVTTVRIITASKQAEHLIVRSQGTVQPRTESQLIPEVSGKVVWMSPALITGGIFEQDAPLLRIDSADYSNAVEKSEAAQTRARVEREHAGDELERVQKLIAQNLASQSQVDEARRRYQVADANLSEADVNLKQAKRDLSRTQINAPYKGMVRTEQVDLGQFVSRGSVIATIYAADFMEVRLPVSSSQLSYLQLEPGGVVPSDPAPAVAIIGQLGQTKFIWHGELVRKESEVDSRSRMFYGVARFRNEPGAGVAPLMVGLFVQAEIQGRLVENVIRLPRSAMRDATQVLVVDTEDRLRFRQVTVLRIEHDEVLVVKGLEDGDRVCVSPLQSVVDGMRVQTVEA
jgi:RND family efflux transporter MFP subunit